MSAEVAAEFLANRRRKRALLTPLAWQGIKREVAKAGWDLQAALQKCVERGWQGFDADWVQSRSGSANKQVALEDSNLAAAAAFAGHDHARSR